MSWETERLGGDEGDLRTEEHREVRVRARKESDRVMGTHKLESSERKTTQNKERIER
jgi:hypothetical protein